MLAKHYAYIYRFILLILLVAFLIAPNRSVALAKAAPPSDPFQNVSVTLTQKGYEVADVSYGQTESGDEDTSQIIVVMAAASQSYDTKLQTQVLDGFKTLYDNFSEVPLDVVGLTSGKYIIIFVTENTVFEQYLDQEIDLNQYWSYIEQNILVYDTEAKRYISAKDFLSKNFGGKDFGDNNKPTPTPTPNPNNQAGYLTFLPSSLYVPADGKTRLGLYANVIDTNRQPLDGEQVTFTLEETGNDPQELGTVATNKSGIAYFGYVPNSELDSQVGIRAFTNNLNSTYALITGALPKDSDVKGQSAMIQKALEGQGYELLPLSDNSDDPRVYMQKDQTPTGDTLYSAVMLMPLASHGFDRAAYTQLLLALGTTATVQPKLEAGMIYLAFQSDNNTYYARYVLNGNDWRQWRDGKIDEVTFWARQQPPDLLDSNFNQISDKNFISKTFQGSTSGDSTTTFVRTRTVEGKRVQESWGPQSYFGQIRIGTSAAAYNFTATLDGNVQSWEIDDIFNPGKPLFIWKQGDDPNAARDKLKKLQLGSGEYFLIVQGNPPASVKLSYQERSAY